MNFVIDPRIENSCVWLTEGPLSRCFLKNEAQFPWFILVPRVESVKDLYQLSAKQRYLLMDEIADLSELMTSYFKPHKLNVATLGNVVSQLHLHIVGRFEDDSLWPHGIWQAQAQGFPYDESLLNKHTIALQEILTQMYCGKGFCSGKSSASDTENPFSRTIRA